MSFFFPSNCSQASLLSIIFVFPRHPDARHSHSGAEPGSDGHPWCCCKRGAPQVPRTLRVQRVCYCRPEHKAKFQICYLSNSQCQISTPQYKAQILLRHNSLARPFFSAVQAYPKPKGDYTGQSCTSPSKESFFFFSFFSLPLCL